MKYYTNVKRDRNDILYRGIENGKRVFKRVPFQPTFYRINPTAKTGWKTLDGRNVTPIQMNGMFEAHSYYKKTQLESDPILFGTKDYIMQFIAENNPEPEIEYDFDRLLIAPLDIETTCEDGFPDVDAAEEQITVITTYNSLEQVYYVFGLKPEGWDWTPEGKNPKIYNPKKSEFLKEHNLTDKVKYFSFKSEREMLQAFLKYWQENYPDIVTGWNITFFDIPYIFNRLVRLFGKEVAKTLSPFDIVNSREVYVMNKIATKFAVIGIETLDYLELYKKFSAGNRSSYKLDYIAGLELGEKKLDYEEYSQMHLFYKNDYPRFIDYNIRDVELIVKLENKLRMIELAVHTAYVAKINYEGVFSAVRTIEHICYNHLLQKNIAMPHKFYNGTKDSNIEGAFVKPPLVGKHDWVVSFDLNSLYPSIIMQQNISPETVVDGMHKTIEVADLINKKLDLSLLKENDVTVCANGHFFKTNKKGFLPEIISQLYSERRSNKKKMLKAEVQAENAALSEEERQQLKTKANIFHIKQYSQKILLNSIYGASANEYFLFFDTRMAEGITKHGQLIIQWAEKYINRYLNKILKTDDIDYVIAIDTDSLYITLDKLVNEVCPDVTDIPAVIDFLDKVCQQKIEPLLQKCYQDLADYTNAFENTMVMKREILASRGIWTGKKHYALNVYDKEGVRYKEPKLKDMGLETAKSSTPEFIREKLKTSIKIALNDTEDKLINFVKDVKEEYMKLSSGDLAYPRSVNGLEKFYDAATLYKKGCPIHVRGSLKYNQMIRGKNLEDKYPLIKSGDKIKFLYLMMPNTAKENVIGFIDEIPPEFELDQFIDHEMMFEKSFIKPLEEIIKHAGWSVRPKPQSLESCFC